MADKEAAEFEKQVVKLPDGRRLIFYRFASPPAAPEPAPPPPDPQKG